jgi:hypothetical protein
MFQEGSFAGQANLPPSAGYQFEGEVGIDGRSRDMLMSRADGHAGRMGQAIALLQYDLADLQPKVARGFAVPGRSASARGTSYANTSIPCGSMRQHEVVQRPSQSANCAECVTRRRRRRA